MLFRLSRTLTSKLSSTLTTRTNTSARDNQTRRRGPSKSTYVTSTHLTTNGNRTWGRRTSRLLSVLHTIRGTRNHDTHSLDMFGRSVNASPINNNRGGQSGLTRSPTRSGTRTSKRHRAMSSLRPLISISTTHATRNSNNANRTNSGTITLQNKSTGAQHYNTMSSSKRRHHT